MEEKNNIYHFEKSYHIPLYRGIFNVVVSNDVEKLEDKFKGEPFQWVYAHALYSPEQGFQGFHVVLNLSHEKRPITHGTIAHEALHITDMIMHERGVVQDRNNDEADAYLIDWVVDMIYRALDEFKMIDKIAAYDAD